MKSLLALIAVLAITPTTFAETLVDDLNVINLRVPKVAIEVTYNYPGINGGDCLLLVTDTAPINLSDAAIEQLASALFVQVGDSILFPNEPGRTLSTLTPVIEDKKLTWPLNTAGAYQTGIRISTKSRRVLAEATQALADSSVVALQVVRGCRL